MGYRIKEIRESKGISQTELSQRSGITRTTIWKLETGEDEVTTTTTLKAIAEALEVSVADLFLAPEV